MSRRPSITVVLPTFDSAAFLAGCLGSVAAQEYDGVVDVLVVDGGSRDDSRALATGLGAVVLDNPERHEESGRTLGVRAATGDLVLLLDADNVLPTRDWLSALVDAMDLADDIVAADALLHEHRPDDPPVVRACALMGGTDPMAVELGWADRWAWHLGRWTTMPVTEERRDGVALVRLDPERPPSMGSNGFLVRREPLLATQLDAGFVHSDVVGDLAEDGWRFARVPVGIVHLYAQDVPTYARKARRRAARTVQRLPPQRRGFRPPTHRLLLQAVSSGTFVVPALLALRGHQRRPDAAAWALYPLLSFLTVAAYAVEQLTALRPGARKAV
jgi:glycosyltransferase involved in cell wall biosynthesis